MGVFFDSSFINCDFPASALVEAAHRAETKQERNLFLSFLIDYFELHLWDDLSASVDLRIMDGTEILELWKKQWNSGKSYAMIAMNAARYCLHDAVCQDIVWRWLHGLISRANGGTHCAFSLRSLLAVGVLCPVLTEPLTWNDPREMWGMEKVLECYQDECTRWAVLEGFTESTPKQAKATLSRFNEWRRAQGKSPIAIDEGELERYVAENGNPEEDDTA